MSQALTFSLTRNGEPIHSIELGLSVVQGPELIDVNEVQPYGFEVDGREADTEYSVWIGDIATGSSAQTASSDASRSTGIARGKFILWDDADYFQGARGPVWIRLASRPRGSRDVWQDRAWLPVVVTSTKLSEQRYHAMYEQLRGLAAGLVLDLVSKTLRSVRLGQSPRAIRIRSSLIELRVLETLWPPIAASLREVAADPVRRLRVVCARQQCWGSERLGPRSLSRMAASGVDPRRRRSSIPFPADVERVVESFDTVEHRVIRGFLDFLDKRAVECRTNLERHIDAIEKDRFWRQRTIQPGPSLFESEDMPRLRRLRDQVKRIERFRQQLRRARRIEPLRGVRPLFTIADTPVFRNVGPYHRIQHEMIRYLTTGLVILEEGTDERIKSTIRMYEQWVFLQLAAAIRSVGLRCLSRQGLLHTSKMFRFTLDIDRGACLTFGAADGRAICLRYEPWIMPEPAARRSLATLYRGRTGEAAWSPDILLELLTGNEIPGEPSEVEYAVVVDAKYTSEIRDHHWEDTNKYLEVRSTRTNRQVARQLWLAYPGAGNQEIIMRDPALQWTPNGPSCSKDETVQGVLRLVPPSEVPGDRDKPGWIAQPEGSAQRFISGLLDYLKIPHGNLRGDE